MSRILIIIGAGGFIGSICRYLSQQFFQKHFPSSFPYGTMWVNIAGCFLIGVIYALSEKGNILTPEWRLFLVTGFCGGFTTFSTFSYENIALLRDGEYFYAAIYSGVSVFGGIIAAFFGILFIKLF
jgi:CrcB protein